MATDERGETLLEVLLAVAIMGVAVVAIMAGLSTSVLMSDIHRKQATTAATVRAYAEAIQHSVADGKYVACAGPSSYAVPAGFDAPDGYAATVVGGSLRYWNGTGWQVSCGTDSGLQRLDIQVSSDRATERLQIIIRKPCRIGDSPCG
jgi:Tfp pilus assembly protein PilV